MTVAPPQMTEKHVDALETAAECGDASKCELDHASLEEITAFVKSALPGGTHRLVRVDEATKHYWHMKLARENLLSFDIEVSDLPEIIEWLRSIAGLSSPIPDGHRK